MNKTQLKNKRYEFRNGILKELSLIDKVGEYFSLSQLNFLSYCRELTVYLDRLTEINKYSSQECPFCSFSFNDKQRAYINKNGSYPFVDILEVHRKYWNEGLIVISNKNGWHLVSELVIPRDHLIDFNSTLKYCKKIFDTCFKRWVLHRQEILNNKDTSKNVSIYHGIAFNKRMGQSVTHSHFHCYTTSYPLIILKNWSRLLFLGQTMTKIPFEIRCSVDDHPNIIAIAKLDKMPNKIEHIINYNSSFLEISKMFNIIQRELYGFEIPGSLGWFFLLKPTPLLIHVMIPIKRHGTIQVFQGDKFRKFKKDTIHLSMLNIINKLSKKLPLKTGGKNEGDIL